MPPPHDGPTAFLPAPALDALARGQTIEAIRLVREQTGLGLKEAKDAVDAYESSHPRVSNLSPGQVSGGGSGVFWLVAIVVAALGYYLFRRLG
ncbi:ribosomal protein L7/L12 [Ramlibacter sp. WS9]|uniref:ribosomal protein L7/L12 n=1 Tax=Ramlibacter sp. WS9 TaxID=1882741 RepID=UPI0013053132|nr:ribosomal protein L7/L12 [Ramlibacter sp. WS9]